jgi:Tfp pilus assembly protein PilN
MIKVNLVPAELLSKARQRQQAVQAGVGGGLLLVIIVIMSIVHWFRLYSLQSTLAYNESEFARLETIVKKVEELDKTANALRARLGVINDLLKGRPSYPIFMSDFTRAVPSGVTIRSMATTGGASAPIKLSMAAESRSSQDIALWIKNMEATGKFSTPELGSVSVTEAGTHNFTVTTTYTPKL